MVSFALYNYVIKSLMMKFKTHLEKSVRLRYHKSKRNKRNILFIIEYTNTGKDGLYGYCS